MIPPINGWTFETISKFFQEQNSAVARLNLALELTTQNSEKFSLVPVHHPYGSKFLKFKVINQCIQEDGEVYIQEVIQNEFVIHFKLADQVKSHDFIESSIKTLEEFLVNDLSAKVIYIILSEITPDNRFTSLTSLDNSVLKNLGASTLEILGDTKAGVYLYTSNCGIPDDKSILTAGPSITFLEQAYVGDAVRSGWNSNHSEYISEFEKQFAEYVGANYALSTSSCTGALHLSLLALEVGPGDEVIVPDITWVATASAIMYVGATPVFADVNKSDWTINIESLKSLINSKTKAIIPVHLYGFAANMNEIIEIASKGEIFVIEDAAPAIGTELSSKRVGTFGDFGCFSFQGAKLLVTGEGGMLVTNNKELYERAKKILDHGRKPGTFWIEEIGHKYKMNNITAALGLAQLHRVQWQIEKKREIYNWYREELSDLNGINFQEESKLTRSICWMTSFTLAPEFDISRDQLISNLRLNKIDSRPVFPAISQYPIWKYQTKAQPNACNIGQNGINLPSGVLLSRKDVRRVSNAIKGILS